VTKAIEMNSAVTLRPIEEGDIDFLQRLFAESWPALDQLPMNDEQKQQLMRMQFQAQHADYQTRFPNAQFDIILLDGEPVGRIYVERNDQEIRLLDIALLSEHRNNGIGSSMLKELLVEAARASLPIRLWVENFNPSFRLFERLGFKPVADPNVDWQTEANWHLEWLPAT